MALAARHSAEPPLDERAVPQRELELGEQAFLFAQRFR